MENMQRTSHGCKSRFTENPGRRRGAPQGSCAESRDPGHIQTPEKRKAGHGGQLLQSPQLAQKWPGHFRCSSGPLPLRPEHTLQVAGVTHQHRAQGSRGQCTHAPGGPDCLQHPRSRKRMAADSATLNPALRHSLQCASRGPSPGCNRQAAGGKAGARGIVSTD